MDNNTWGGKRKNAGRKKIDGNAVLYCRMPQDAVDKIKASAKQQSLTVGDYIIKQLKL